MRSLLAVLLLAGTAGAVEVPGFARKPVAVREGATTRIEFETAVVVGERRRRRERRRTGQRGNAIADVVLIGTRERIQHVAVQLRRQ